MLLETRLKCGGRSHRYVSRSFTSMDSFFTVWVFVKHGGCRVSKHEMGSRMRIIKILRRFRSLRRNNAETVLSAMFALIIYAEYEDITLKQYICKMK